MKVRIIDLIDFEKVDTLLEGFNKSTGFVTAILDLEGNVLSKSGWRQICTEFHRVHPETSKRCTTSDTILANKMKIGEKYHFYECLNGLIDVAVPIVIKGEHVANLFSGQFFFEQPDSRFFEKQAEKFGFNENHYLNALSKVPVVSKEKVIAAMDFLLNMTQLISEMTFQKLEQTELNEAIKKNERILRLFVEHSPASIAMFDNNMRYLVASHRFMADYNLGNVELIGRSHYEVFPEISERWKEFHRRGLAGETLKEDNDLFPRVDGKTDWVRWEIRPWYESENKIGGIILFSEVITAQIEDRETLRKSEAYNRMLFEQSAIGLALTSLDGKLVDINPTFANIIGRTIEETKSLTYWDLTPVSYQEQEQVQLESLAKTGKYGPYEKEYIHKNGHLVPVRLQGLIIERNNEKFIWSSVEDISERKQAEMLLTESERKYRYLFKNNPLPMWIYDLQTLKFIEVNEAAINHYGYSKERFLSMSLKDIRPIEDVPELEKDVESTHYAYNKAGVWRHKKENGEIILVEIISHLIDFDGIPSRLVLANDVTERKRAEEELELKNAELQTLNRVILKTTEVLDLRSQLESIMDEALQIIGLEGGTICLVKSDNTFELAAHRETSAETIFDLTTNQIKIGDCLCGNCALDCRPLILNTPEEVLKYATREVIRGEDIRFHAAMPFIVQGKCVGVLCAFTRTDKKPDGRSLKLLETICAQAAVSVENARLFENLHQSEELLRLSTELANVAAWELDIANDSVTRSKNHDHLFGLEIQESWHFDTFMNATHPDDREMSKTIIQNSLASGGPDECQYDFRVVYPDHTVHWLNVIGQVTKRDAQGKGLLVHGFSIDITERKLAEEALQKSEKQYRTLFETMVQGVIYQNVAGEIISANPAAGEILGLSIDQMTGRKSIDPRWKAVDQNRNILPGEKHPAMVALRTGKEVKNFTQGIFNPKKNGYVWILVNSIPQFEEGDKKPYQVFSTFLDITERKKAEAKLIESEERFRLATEQSNVAVWEYDFNSNSMARSGNHDKLYGLEWQTKWDINTFLNATHPEDREYSNNYIMNSVSPGGSDDYSFSFRVVFPDNSIRWLLVNGYVIERIESGQGIKVRGTLIDVTDIKKAEEALSHSHELMKYIIEHNQSAVAVHDKNLNYLYVSQRYLTDYKVKEKDIIGKHHYEVFPDIPEKWRKVHQKALKGIVSRADEDIFVRDDGTFDWTRWECRPWYEADGSIGGLILYSEVINEQKRKEEETKKLSQRLEILIESIQQLSATQSLESVQDIVAKSARKLIGADGATLVFRENDNCYYVNEDAIQPLWKGKKFPMDSCISGWVMQHKKPVAIEDVFSDDRIPHDVYSPTFVKSLAMVPVNISEPIGAIGNYWKEKYTPTETEMQLLQTLADATARSIENIQLYTELEDRVNRRTEQLQAANKQLETFTYSVSHDLKAPLRGIDGYSKLLLDEYGGKLNEEAAHFIKTIRSSTFQMNRLIDDLLSYSRLERSELRKEKINLEAFVGSLTDSYRSELKGKGFTVKISVPGTEIVADATGLSIALRNFIENAIKFTSGKPNPLIEIGFDEKPETWIIKVKDNGVGFEMKYHDRIFEIFQRLHRAEDFPGTGIGLAMVAKAAHRMNGIARAESIPGKGSTFFIEIPKNNSI